MGSDGGEQSRGAGGEIMYSMLSEVDSQPSPRGRVAVGNCVITFYATDKLIGLNVTSGVTGHEYHQYYDS